MPQRGQVSAAAPTTAAGGKTCPQVGLGQGKPMVMDRGRLILDRSLRSSLDCSEPNRDPHRHAATTADWLDWGEPQTNCGQLFSNEDDSSVVRKQRHLHEDVPSSTITISSSVSP